MANVSRKWKSSTWRLGKSRAKEPEMIESPLPHGWSFTHDLDREQNHQLQSETAAGLLDKGPSRHLQGRLSESPEVRERLESLVSEIAKPGHARSDSAGSLRMGSHVSNIVNFEQAYNKPEGDVSLGSSNLFDGCIGVLPIHSDSNWHGIQKLKGERDMFEEFFLTEQMRLRRVEEEFVAKEAEFASVMHEASRAADLERELKSSSDYCGKLERQIQEKTLEAQAANERIRTYISRNQAVAESSGQEQRMKDLEDEHSRTNTSLKLEINWLKEQLARSDARCLETKQALDSKSTEVHLMKECMRHVEGQLAESEEEAIRLHEKFLILEEEVSKLQADNMELQLQLELESSNEAKLEEDWINERAEWEARVAHLETELNLASCTNGELDFLITPMKGTSDRTLGSPRTPTGHFSIQTLLDLGEASLEVEDDFHELRLKHADAEVRVQSATHELQTKEQQLVEFREIVSQLKAELAAEKEKSKEEAEDLTQEMAELRYQLMEMVEQERELRAQVEQASVRRVEELEAQVKDAREEVLHSLVQRREAEVHAEGCNLEVQHLQLANENLEKELKEAEENSIRAREEVEAEGQQAKNHAQHLAESNLELEKQVRDVCTAHDCLSRENLHLQRSLDEAVARTLKLQETLAKKESEYHSLLEVERNTLEASMTTVAKFEEEVLSFEKKESQYMSHLEQERKEIGAFKAALANYEKEKISLLEKESEDVSLIEELRKQVEVLTTSLANFEKEQQEGEVTKMELVNTHDKEMQVTGISPSLSREVGGNSALETDPEIAVLHSHNDQLQADAKTSSVGDTLSTPTGEMMTMDNDGNVNVPLGSLSSIMDDASTTLSKQVEEEVHTEMEDFQQCKNVLQLDVESPVAGIKKSPPGITSVRLDGSGDSLGTPGLHAVMEEEKFVCTTKLEHLWAVKEIAEMIESITEELTKQVQLMLHDNSSTKSELAFELDLRVRSWSNILIRALQSKLASGGAVEEEEQGEHGADLLGESRPELASSTHQDFEVEIGSVETLHQEQVAANQEVTHSKDEEPERLEECHESEISQRDDEVSNLQQKPQAILGLELHVKTLQENFQPDEERHKYSDSLVLPS